MDRLTVFGSSLLVAHMAATSAWADVAPVFPHPAATETKTLLLLGLVFAVLVSGISFVLLWRMAWRKSSVSSTLEETRDAGIQHRGEAIRPEAGDGG